MILETSFVIDLERELARGVEGPAARLLRGDPARPLYLTVTVAGELAAGPLVDQRQKWEDFLAPFQILPITRDACWEYGKVYRYLRDNGLLVGSNDLWIAATALAFGLPVVTRNERHYRRIPGLRVVSYGP